MSQRSHKNAAKENKPELSAGVKPVVEGQTADVVSHSAADALQRFTTAPDGAPNPADVLALQRTVGNQAVQRSLTADSSLRGGFQPAAAPIRQATGVVQRATGVVQREGTGIAKGKTVKQYAEGTRDMQSEWEKMSAAERANKLGELANAALATVKVPAVNILMADLGSSSGSFSNVTWTLKVNQSIVSKDTVTEAELAEVSNTFYHEARHAEQYYRVARYVAGLGMSANYIATRLGIPARIAKEAVSNPLKAPGILDEMLGNAKELAQEFEEAKRWTDSLGPVGTKRYKKVMAELKEAEKALEDALAAFKASQTDENKEKVKKARDVYNKKYLEYRNFVEEKDAWKVGGEAEKAFKNAGGGGD